MPSLTNRPTAFSAVQRPANVGVTIAVSFAAGAPVSKVAPGALQAALLHRGSLDVCATTSCTAAATGAMAFQKTAPQGPHAISREICAMLVQSTMRGLHIRTPIPSFSVSLEASSLPTGTASDTEQGQLRTHH